jgi:hypothetical protein
MIRCSVPIIDFCASSMGAGSWPPHDEGPQDHRDRITALRPDLKTAIDAIIGLYLRLRYSARGSRADREQFSKQVRSFSPARRPPSRRQP